MLLEDRGFEVPAAFRTNDKTKIEQSYSWPGKAAEQEKARRNAGRYQIREAAEQLQLHAGERADTMIDKLSKAAFEGNLPVHLPGEKARHAYPQDGIVRSNASTLPGGISYFAGTDWRQHVRDFYEEAYWDDLNAWLSENEPRIDWRFPRPITKQASLTEETIHPNTTTISTPDWRVAARNIADELFERDTANQCRDSLDGYSMRTMEEMQKRQIHGPRGRIDNHKTVQREALQGPQWWQGKKK
ncbi:hypothetical protein [Dechloromonas sp. HYN0024]|uniref:hypothetical protein n=1 Tax=Dechloromonas sp. HYN0024 TaxID=2231055 RepID=UPI000E437DB6|nr:hypothetical protein [Dechloromonas sp. HYN0024]AXS80856.1 hypothetical protein HYN24_12980 [Dechloromonas sp. HYN0024]